MVTNLERAVAALVDALGENLHSCCLYGSAVRGNLVEGVSDLNLLIVLNVSDQAAHERVAAAIGGWPGLEPFVLGRAGFPRSVRAFAAKFASIQRNYRVLHGADPLAGLEIDAALERFLCEQALRNLRLRLVHAFVTRARTKAYGRFLPRSVTPMFLRFSEILRLEGIDVPVPFSERIALFERHFAIDGAVLREMLAVKLAREAVPEAEAARWHERVFPLVDAVVRWVEKHWPGTAPGETVSKS